MKKTTSLDPSHPENYIDALRKELLYLIEKELTPLALKYRYSEVPLETKVKWKPIVLLLGNYSSGKSTLINEFLGTKIQLTGQAPTDDCFTVITSEDEVPLPAASQASAPPSEVEERDGKVLLYDKQYPFELLRKHGDRFAAHFRLKKIRGIEQLKNLAIIDTPGMLDSVSEKDRGYNYQEVIGDLASMADLVLVLFDPHKAGTIRESYASLRETLPEKTYEDRIIFVLNRIDECGNLEDLIRVYGTLCWNLSQMTGRKDIPKILLTYANSKQPDPSKDFLKLLDNQRSDLQTAIYHAPKHRLDHLATFVEHHTGRMAHLLEALLAYNQRKSTFVLKCSLAGFILSLFIAGLVSAYLDLVNPFPELSTTADIALGGGVGLFLYSLWVYFVYRYLVPWQNLGSLDRLEELSCLDTQQRCDSWNAIVEPLRLYLADPKRKSSSATLRRESELIKKINTKGAQEIRTAINALSSTKFSLGATVSSPPRPPLPL